MQPSERVVIELPRADGSVTRVVDNGDGTQDVISLWGDKELERYTRKAPERSK